MALKRNPKKLNKLQLKTLALFQGFANSDIAGPGEDEGEIHIGQIPQPHGNHFHVGNGVVMTKDAIGLNNRGVWAALDRKGLMRSGVFPFTTTLTLEGLDYDTGMKGQIIHSSDH
jgi:hypothetical protein